MRKNEVLAPRSSVNTERSGAGGGMLLEPF